VASEPEKFHMPAASDKRYNWVRVWLDAIDEAEMRELVVEAWRMGVPKRVAASYPGPDPLLTWWACEPQEPASLASSSASARQARSKSARCRLSSGPCARQSGSAPTLVTRIAASGKASANSATNGIEPPTPISTVSRP